MINNIYVPKLIKQEISDCLHHRETFSKFFFVNDLEFLNGSHNSLFALVKSINSSTHFLFLIIFYFSDLD
jgi:hypothetical protein